MKSLHQWTKGGSEDVDLAVQAARQVFEEGPWSKMKPAEREKLLLKLAELLDENAEELAHLERGYQDG